MFDIVDLKTTIYKSRFEAEFNLASGDGNSNGCGTFDAVRHDLERVREELFSLPFEQAGRELVIKFQKNFQRLREFMERVDKDIAQLAVFNVQKGDHGTDDQLDEDDNYGDEQDENDVSASNKHNLKRQGTAGNAKATSLKKKKFKGISSVGQLKHLLRNYDALVEGQHVLLNQSIAKMAKIPPVDEIQQSFNRFQILKDSELDDMRAFISEHKNLMQT